MKQIIFKKGAEVKGKHDDTINFLIKRLKKCGDYDFIGKNLEYKIKDSNNVLGEVDAYALRTINNVKNLFLFEIKTNNNIYNRAKAINQLYKSKNYLSFLGDKTRILYVYFDSFSKGYVRTELIK